MAYLRVRPFQIVAGRSSSCIIRDKVVKSFGFVKKQQQDRRTVL